MRQKAKFIGYKVTAEGSVLVSSVFREYKSRDIMLVVIDTKTKYPSIDGIGSHDIYLSASPESINRGESEEMTCVAMDVPKGMKIWNADTGRYSVNITFVREEISG